MIPTFRPQDQTLFGNEEGNCYAACVASVTGIPLEEVPNFCLKSTWLADSINWLRDRGWGVFYLYDVAGERSNLPGTVRWWSSYPCIVTGKSPRGDWLHCVVDQGGEVVHDPHPDKTGILPPTRDAILVYPLVQEDGR